MSNYAVSAINIGSFNLGESDKIITLFSSEKGLIRAVAKGARKPGAKIGGRAEILAINKLYLAQGRSLDIITQAETIENFKELRKDLVRLAYAFYYAELTVNLGQGLSQESHFYFELLCRSLRDLCDLEKDPVYLCLVFQLALLQMLGLKPELDSCVSCRTRLGEYNLSVFEHDLGGVICTTCFSAQTVPAKNRKGRLNLAETENQAYRESSERDEAISSYFTYLTPLVWKNLISAIYSPEQMPLYMGAITSKEKSLIAARNLLETYLEHRIGKKMNSLGLIS